MKIGDPCRAACTAPARYIGHGRCLFVSAMCNELSVADAELLGGSENHLPLPTDEETRKAAKELQARIKELEKA